jgi:MYXO-CTERM domain-containing protein
MVKGTITDSLRMPIAAAAAMLAAAGAAAGVSAPVAGPIWPSPLGVEQSASAVGPLGHGQNDRPVPVAAGPFGHSANESPVPGLQPDLEWWATGIGELGALDGVAVLFGAAAPWAAPSGAGAVESVAALLDRRPAWLDDGGVIFALPRQPGGAAPATPVPGPGALSLLGLVALAVKRRPRRG